VNHPPDNEKADAGLQPDAGRGNQLRAGAMNKPNHTSVSPTADSRKWMPFDTWLKHYEAARDRELALQQIPGGPHGY
jgi:hypothetical protein